MTTVSSGSAEKPARGNAFHMLIAIVLIIVTSVVTYVVLRAVYFVPFTSYGASAEADLIDPFINFHFAVIASLFSLVMVFMLYSLYAFRLRPGETAIGQYMHGNTVLEIAWIILPTVAVIAAAIWALSLFNQLRADDDSALIVEVTGRQWSWLFGYPDQDDKLSQVMVLPVDRPVRLEMQSGDVLHSFWVPEFRVKQDLLPGCPERASEAERESCKTVLRFTPTEIGEYKVRCAEICGTSHHAMRAWVVVLSQADYDTWAATGELPEDVAAVTSEQP